MDQLPKAWNDPAELEEFLARFSYMFPLMGSEQSRSYVFFRGWMPRFALLCGEIDVLLTENRRGFAWTKIREKFGGPSLSYQMLGRARHVIHAHRPTEVRKIDCEPVESFEPVAVAIQDAVLLVELKLRETCIVCGAKSTITNDRGPWASLCSQHRLAPRSETIHRWSETVWTTAQLRVR